MSIKESALSVISSIAQSDLVRAVTSDGNSRRVTVANLAKAIVESYTGSSLGGSQRSVKAAIDSLNSKTIAGYGAITEVTTTEKSQTITFAQPFPYAPKVVVCLFRNGYNRRLHVSNITATDFTVTGALLSGSSSAAIEFQWIAHLG